MTNVILKAGSLLLKSVIDRKTYFCRESYYLLEKKLDTWDGAIKSSFAIPGTILHVISKPEELDRLCADGYDFHGCPNLAYLKGGLAKKALLIFAFVGKEFAHSTLVAIDDNVCVFDPLYKNMRNKDAGYIGPCYTNPLFRGKGVYPLVLSRACMMLKEMGKKMAFINTKKANVASLRGIEKAGFDLVGEVDLKKVLFWKKYWKVSA